MAMLFSAGLGRKKSRFKKKWLFTGLPQRPILKIGLVSILARYNMGVNVMWTMDDFIISTDRALLDLDLIHTFITRESYWGADRSRQAMEKVMKNSALCFGVYHEESGTRRQIGFARVVSDLAVFGYIADVFILSDYRGKGLGKWLIDTIVNHPELRALKRITLFTRTPEFYSHSDFEIYDQDKQPAKLMVRM